MAELIVSNAALLDLETDDLTPGSSARVAGGRIVEVAGGQRIVGDVSRLDANGRTLLPGLIHAHVHAAITTLDMPGLAGRSTTRSPTPLDTLSVQTDAGHAGIALIVQNGEVVHSAVA